MFLTRFYSASDTSESLNSIIFQSHGFKVSVIGIIRIVVANDVNECYLAIFLTRNCLHHMFSQ